MSDEKMARIAIVNADKCKPKKCRQECKRNCPVVRTGKNCVEVDPTSKISVISEELCIGCGICVKKCPFSAISIINLPGNLASETTHRFSANSFKLHRLPMPRPNEVLGLVGTNGIGKSTALKILSGKLKPNLGRFDAAPEWSEILKHWRGSDLQNYFSKILEDSLKAVMKPQYVDHIPKTAKGKVGHFMETKGKDHPERVADLMAQLQLEHVADREVEMLSGGELQRFAIGIVAVQDADVYMFDEPSSYLDVKQRLKASQVIRLLVEREGSKYIVVVEHDLSILDYLSDFICVLYGVPSAYGVVTMPFSVRDGINIFLAGFVPTENLRFRAEALTFRVAEVLDEVKGGDKSFGYNYPQLRKTLRHDTADAGASFSLTVDAGGFSNSQIIVMLGENGTGKTTFIRMLAGLLKADPDADGKEPELEGFSVSYKPQKIVPKETRTVRQLFHDKIRESCAHAQFQTDVIRPMTIEPIIDQLVEHLSGGELQRVALCLCLGKPADVYLIDEPSAYLDSEQRITASKVIKRFILHAKKTAFVVEHDFIMATYLADKVIVYEGSPGRDCRATAPQGLLTGMNMFLQSLDITFRRDPTNNRPRINKWKSVKDADQKRAGTFFYLDE